MRLLILYASLLGKTAYTVDSIKSFVEGGVHISKVDSPMDFSFLLDPTWLG